MPVEGRSAANSTSTVYELGRVIKSTPGTLYKITFHNSNIAARWLQLHDAAAVPADTAVPTLIYKVGIDTSVTIDFSTVGRYFTTGIVAVSSTTGPTKTASAADGWFDAQYV